MIGRILRGCTSLLVYVCVATIIAQAMLCAYLAYSWKLNRTKVIQVLAIAQGIDLFAMKDEARREAEDTLREQISLKQIMQTRAEKVRHLELREEALANGLKQLRFETGKLAGQRKRYQQVKESFDAQLAEMQKGATAEGMDEVRRKLLAIKPKQAKELLVRMLEKDKLDDVVILLKAMPDVKCAKIMAEFKSADEIEQLGEVLRRLREGFPLADLGTRTREKLEPPKETAP